MPTRDINQKIKLVFEGGVQYGGPYPVRYAACESIPRRVNFILRDYSQTFEECSSSVDIYKVYNLPDSSNGMPLTNGLWLPADPSIQKATNNIGGVTYLESYDITNNSVSTTDFELFENQKWALKFARVVLNNTEPLGKKLLVQSLCSKDIYDPDVVGVKEEIKLSYSVSQGIAIPVTITLFRRFN